MTRQINDIEKGLDSWDYLRVKEQLIESDCNAVFSDGRKAPVYIFRANGISYSVLDNITGFPEATKLVGFLRFEKQPSASVVEDALPEPPQLTGTNAWRDAATKAAEAELRARAERQRIHKGMNSVPKNPPPAKVYQRPRNADGTVKVSVG